MKHLIAALTTFVLLGFAIPAFACDGHGAADEATTTASTEPDTESDHACTASCKHDEKKAKVNEKKAKVNKSKSADVDNEV